MKNLFLNLSIATILILFVSCVNSNDVKQETPIFQRYMLIRNKTTNKCFAAVNFRLHKDGETNLNIQDNMKLTCNGKEGKKFINSPSWDLDCNTDCNFVFTKENGKTFKNNIKASDVRDIAISDSFKSFKKDENLNFKWEGKPIQEEETLEISIKQDGLDFPITIKSKMVNSESINIKKEDLAKLTKGKAFVELIRIREFKAQETDQNAGGILETQTIVQKDITIE